MQEKPKRESNKEAFESNARELLELIRKKNPELTWDNIARHLGVVKSTLDGYIYHGKIPTPVIMLKLARMANNNGIWTAKDETGEVIFKPKKTNVDI